MMLAETKADALTGDMALSMDSGDEAPRPDDADDAWLPTAAARLLPAKASVAREWISRRGAGLRSWREFLKTDRFRLPSSPAVATKRVVRNVDYFQSNYLCIFIVLLLYCVLTSPFMLVALAACFGLLYGIRRRSARGSLTVAGRELSLTYQYGLVALLSFPLFYIAGAGAIIFWVIGASLFVIVAHAAAYASEPVAGEDFILEEV